MGRNRAAGVAGTVVLVVAAMACGGAGGRARAPASPPVAPAGPPITVGDGEILARAPCPVAADPLAFGRAIEAYLQADVERAGLTAELAARPVATLFPPADHARLVAASRTGRCERVVYRSGGLRVVGFVVRPAAPPRPGARHPVVLWLRGGNRELGKVGPFALVHMLDLAEAGFVVVATQYRGVDGGDGVEQYGGDDVDDVFALVPLARGLADADADRLFLLGGSRGAMQGLIAMRRGLRVRAAAFRGGLYDLGRLLDARPELEVDPVSLLIPEWSRDRAGAIERRSATRWAGELRTPTLLVHGRQDWRVQVDDAFEFAGALADAGVEHELVVYEREEHQLAFHRRQWIAAVAGWFHRHDRAAVAAK